MKIDHESSELLNSIYQNAQMGVETLSHLKAKTEDSSLLDCIDGQLRGYEAIHGDAKSKLHENGCSEKQPGGLTKAGATFTLNMQTLTNKSSSHLAQMMIEGSTTGIIDMTKKIQEFRNAEPDVIALAERLTKFEQGNIENIKRFLS